MDCDEHIILKKLRDGDSEALDILYLRYASKVRDFAFRLLKDRTDAEDIRRKPELRRVPPRPRPTKACRRTTCWR